MALARVEAGSGGGRRAAGGAARRPGGDPGCAGYVGHRRARRPHVGAQNGARRAAVPRRPRQTDCGVVSVTSLWADEAVFLPAGLRAVHAAAPRRHGQRQPVPHGARARRAVGAAPALLAKPVALRCGSSLRTSDRATVSLCTPRPDSAYGRGHGHPGVRAGPQILDLLLARATTRRCPWHTRPALRVHMWARSLADECGQLTPIIGTTTHYSTSPRTSALASNATHMRIGGHGRAC